jgi:hypothetical protein
LAFISLNDGVAIYAAVLSTGVAVIQLLVWLRSRVDAKVTVLPHKHVGKPDRYSHIDIDVQATKNPISIRAIYLAGYKSRWHWLFGGRSEEVVNDEWSKIFPKTIEPGHGWEGLFALNDPERALSARYGHVRMTVRHTGIGKTTSKPVTKFLRR